MSGNELDSVEECERLVRQTVKAWTADQRLAFAAALAESWLWVYDRFSAESAWGDPEALRRILDAVWDHLQGRILSASDRVRYSQQVGDLRPSMDDCDAWKAMNACRILDHALECCETEGSEWAAFSVAQAGFEAAVPDWPLAAADQRRVWQQASTQQEISKQMALLGTIGASVRFDHETVEALRRASQGRAKGRPESSG
jgi:uncharacterized protein YjaG (DUF416 family)